MRRESVDRAPHLEAGDGALAATGVTAGRILARGKLCAVSARKALPRLAEQLGLALPAAPGANPHLLYSMLHGEHSLSLAPSWRTRTIYWTNPLRGTGG